MPDPATLFAYNRYMYVAGNPMRLRDSSGHVWETVADVAAVGYDIYDIYNNGLSWSSGGALAADLVGAALPFAPAPSTCIRWCDDALQYGDEALNYVGDKASSAWTWGKNLVGLGDEAAQVAGAGIGRWARHGEVADPSIVQQASGNWCVLACSEMLSNGRVTQQKLSDLVNIMPGGTDIEDVAAAMNVLDSAATGIWQAGYVGPQAFNALNSKGAWGAMMKIDGGHHMVVVDGLNKAGMVMVRDPYGATRYNMALDEFMSFWNGNAIFSQ